MKGPKRCLSKLNQLYLRKNMFANHVQHAKWSVMVFKTTKSIIKINFLKKKNIIYALPSSNTRENDMKLMMSFTLNQYKHTKSNIFLLCES